MSCGVFIKSSSRSNEYTASEHAKGKQDYGWKLERFLFYVELVNDIRSGFFTVFPSWFDVTLYEFEFSQSLCATNTSMLHTYGHSHVLHAQRTFHFIKWKKQLRFKLRFSLKEILFHWNAEMLTRLKSFQRNIFSPLNLKSHSLCEVIGMNFLYLEK